MVFGEEYVKSIFVPFWISLIEPLKLAQIVLVILGCILDVIEDRDTIPVNATSGESKQSIKEHID